MNTNLETMAANLVKATGCTMEEARAGLRVEILRFRVALGQMTLEAANVEFAAVGIKMRRAA